MASEFLLTTAIQRYFFTKNLTLRSVTDGVTAASTTVTSATAAFSASDVGASISGGTIPGGATIASVTNATTVVISAAATVATNVTLTITRTNTLGIAAFQTAINTDLAAYFTTVPTLVTQPGAANTPMLIVNPNLILSVPPGSWIGYNQGNWQVLPDAAMQGSVFTATNV